MNVIEAINARRSVKKFTGRPVSRSEIESLLEVAVMAPNHRMTQPWRFIVLGPVARRKFGAVLGARKAKKIEDPAAAAAVREKVTEEHAALPAMIAVAMHLDQNPETREEDFAATWMAIQNIVLAAQEMGLGSHIKTGAVMDDPATREALGVDANTRIVATIHLGEPAELPPARPRASAAEKTRWLS